MKIVHLGRLQRASAARKAGYLEAHQKIGRPVTIFGQPFLQLTDGDYAAIRREFALVATPLTKPVVSLSGLAPCHTGAMDKTDSEIIRRRSRVSTIQDMHRIADATALPNGFGVKQRPGVAKLPALGTMAKNVVGAAGRVVTAAASGERVQASEETFQRRMKICTACEFLDKATQRCGKCGCFVSAQVIGKARLATEKCPEGRW